MELQLERISHSYNMINCGLRYSDRWISHLQFFHWLTLDSYRQQLVSEHQVKIVITLVLKLLCVWNAFYPSIFTYQSKCVLYSYIL